MTHSNTEPYIPVTPEAITILDYYSDNVRSNPDFLADYIDNQWHQLTPEERLAFEIFQAGLYPGNLVEQQLAARRTLLAPYIRQQVRVAGTLERLFSES